MFRFVSVPLKSVDLAISSGFRTVARISMDVETEEDYASTSEWPVYMANPDPYQYHDPRHGYYGGYGSGSYPYVDSYNHTRFGVPLADGVQSQQEAARVQTLLEVRMRYAAINTAAIANFLSIYLVNHCITYVYDAIITCVPIPSCNCSVTLEIQHG